MRKELQEELSLETIMPLEYPDTWGADKYSILSIKKVQILFHVLVDGKRCLQIGGRSSEEGRGQLLRGTRN
ncbi:unnamed protein product, partial [Mesorhabditis belari]|uniref:Uncharacterized protein n=1 Tax=Mesorhabditis belari TaxID=2138241 RepID=A0AAF3FQQ5_9BILA